MAKILQGIQDDNPKANPLTEVASVEDGEDEVTYAECVITGILKAHQREVKKVPAPANAEQLRFRCRVLDNGYLYGRFNHANKQWLSDFELGFFSTSLAGGGGEWPRGSVVSRITLRVRHPEDRHGAYQGRGAHLGASH